MSQVSKYPLKKEVFERIFELLQKVIVDSRDQHEAQNLLDDLLTPCEKIMLAKRLAIAILLAKGYSYRVIQEILRVSKPTIAMVNLSFKYKGKGYQSFVEKVLHDEKSKEFWGKVDDLVLKTISHGKGSSGWRYLHHELKNRRWKKKTPI